MSQFQLTGLVQREAELLSSMNSRERGRSMQGAPNLCPAPSFVGLPYHPRHQEEKWMSPPCHCAVGISASSIFKVQSSMLPATCLPKKEAGEEQWRKTGLLIVLHTVPVPLPGRQSAITALESTPGLTMFDQCGGVQLSVMMIRDDWGTGDGANPRGATDWY